MKSIELRVPNAIEHLTSAEQDRLLRTALRAAARQRARELVRERREAVTHIRRYERKYGATLAQFERQQLSGLDAVQAHENYNDWFFWGTVLARAESAIRNPYFRAEVERTAQVIYETHLEETPA